MKRARSTDSFNDEDRAEDRSGLHISERQPSGTSSRGDDAILILLLTDIGRDIDDTLALIALQGLQRRGKIRLVGVVGTGGAGIDRARVVRWWLRRFHIADHDCPVAYCRSEGKLACAIPAGTPVTADAALVDGSAAAMIVDLARAHAHRLVIFAIAPLAPLADALADAADLKLLRSNVHSLWIQGQVKLEAAGRLSPDFASFNLRENRQAALTVFNALQDYVPFRLLGKHAAYQVPLTPSDFSRWDGVLGSTEMTDLAKRNLAIFRSENPALFYKLYPVSEEQRTTADWFDALDVLSHPYDPLLAVFLTEGALFDPTHETGAAGVEHMHVGNEPGGKAGIVDAAALKSCLCTLVSDGLSSL